MKTSAGAPSCFLGQHAVPDNQEGCLKAILNPEFLPASPVLQGCPQSAHKPTQPEAGMRSSLQHTQASPAEPSEAHQRPEAGRWSGMKAQGVESVSYSGGKAMGSWEKEKSSYSENGLPPLPIFDPTIDYQLKYWQLFQDNESVLQKYDDLRKKRNSLQKLIRRMHRGDYSHLPSRLPDPSSEKETILAHQPTAELVQQLIPQLITPEDRDSFERSSFEDPSKRRRLGQNSAGTREFVEFVQPHEESLDSKSTPRSNGPQSEHVYPNDRSSLSYSRQAPLQNDQSRQLPSKRRSRQSHATLKSSSLGEGQPHEDTSYPCSISQRRANEISAEVAERTEPGNEGAFEEQSERDQLMNLLQTIEMHDNPQRDNQRKKHVRRCAKELLKNYPCLYNCGKDYATDAARNMHMREKHGEVTKTERDRKAREIVRQCNLKNSPETIQKLSQLTMVQQDKLLSELKTQNKENTNIN